jgi:Cu+-exporting ATPase
MAKDPVCGMTVDDKKAPAATTYEGKTYYFCAASCRDKFLSSPKTYVGGDKR